MNNGKIPMAIYIKHLDIKKGIKKVIKLNVDASDTIDNVKASAMNKLGIKGQLRLVVSQELGNGHTLSYYNIKHLDEILALPINRAI